MSVALTTRAVLRAAPAHVTAVAALLLALAAPSITAPAAHAGQSSQATSTPVAQVAAGAYHSCALLDHEAPPVSASSPVRCWGFSGDGQLGYGNRSVVGDDEAPASVGPVDLGPGRTARACSR